MPHPRDQKTFVQAGGVLAEHMCHAHLMDLTLTRAAELRWSHREHRPDDCFVHLQAALLLAEQSET